MKHLFFLSILVLQFNKSFSQVIFIPTISYDEHGFLPGKKFPIYNTIAKFNFNGKKVSVKLFDNRFLEKIDKIECSDLKLTNTSELANPQSIIKIKDYIEKIFADSNLNIDSTSVDKIEFRLEALDSRLYGVGYVKAHGLCQMKIKFNNFEKIYCTDIVDGDKNSPLSASAFVTRKTATRFMASASIRENIEKFLIDIREMTK